uniref:NIDO domain-containing protein n=1 Tax=Anser brachyrhynchus TaxID=132585 RepID=A0A8B9C4C4_9AVES
MGTPMGTPMWTGTPLGTGTTMGMGTPIRMGSPVGTGIPMGTGTPTGTGTPVGTGTPWGDPVEPPPPRSTQMKAAPVLLLLFLLGHTGGRPVSELLYPFGPEEGDMATPREDDGMSPEILLWETFSFYGVPHRSLYVNNNGVVSFRTGVSEFTPNPFPLPGHRPFVAPYWADVDTRLGGDVFYRQTRSPELLARLTRELAPAVSPPEQAPQPTWAFVATWDRVSFFGAASDKVGPGGEGDTEGTRRVGHEGTREWGVGIRGDIGMGHGDMGMRYGDMKGHWDGAWGHGDEIWGHEGTLGWGMGTWG